MTSNDEPTGGAGLAGDREAPVGPSEDAADEVEIVDAEVVEGDEELASESQAETREAEERVEEDLDELSVAQRERDEYLELAQRTRADFENFRKRVAGEAAGAVERGKAELARELIPALDNLDLALAAAGIDPTDPSAGNDEGLSRGVVLVRSELGAALERAGVTAFDPVGERFDPSQHEAISTRSEQGAEAGVIVETLDRGYRLGESVIRPARVVVAAE